MKKSNLTPTDFEERRKQFLKKIKGAVAVLPSAPEVTRNDETLYEYRQESNFYYLSGFEEPQSVLMFVPHSKTPFQMFVRHKDKLQELWGGKIWGVEAAKRRFGANEAFSSLDRAKFDDQFVTALAEADRLYYKVGVDPDFDQKIFALFQATMKKLGRTGRPLWPILDPTDLLGEMRAAKSKPEVERCAKAAAITAKAHNEIMKLCRAGMFEYEIEAALFHEFRRAGAKRLGYPSIVASGANACVLHYTANDRQMKKGDLLLIDAGAEYDYYTGDITRTFPVSGTFTKEQKEIYAAVLKAQKECIKMARPGKTQIDIHDHAVKVLIEEMKKLKILKGPTKEILKKETFRTYYPHRTGHFLGMDVHDAGRYYAGSYSNARKLEPGMLFTVEPGLYFSDPKSPAKYRGIGVRIEDDVLITKNGYQVLTSETPKEIEEVESFCQNHN